MWLEISFARTQVYMFLWYWWCNNRLEALESIRWKFVKRSHWSALKVEWDIIICNWIIICLIDEHNFFHREMFGEADLVDIFPPQIRYGPINFLIAGSKKFFDQLSELPGYQQNRTWPTHPLKQKLDKWSFIVCRNAKRKPFLVCKETKKSCKIYQQGVSCFVSFFSHFCTFNF